jgi:hypothetical protein
MIDTVKHKKILKEHEFRKRDLMIYVDRSEEHPNGAYKFQQKDWQVNRFIDDAKQIGWTLSSMRKIYDEAIAEVKRLRKALTAIAKQPEGRGIMDCYPRSHEGIILKEMLE